MELLPTQNKEERGLRKSQRTSRTNLKRNSISPLKSAPETEIVRKTYELNADKAIYKKMDTCTTEHLRTEFKAKHNIRIFLSTSAYELVRFSMFFDFFSALFPLCFGLVITPCF
jgi:hypothetical protein